MVAVFDDHSLIQHVNAIAAHHGSDMMADQHDRMLGFQRTQGVDHDLLVFGVQRAGGFVEHKDRRFGEERPRQSDPLALPARKVHTGVEQCRLVLIWQCFYKVGRACQARRLADLFECRCWATISNVLGDRCRLDHAILQDQGDMTTDAFQLYLSQIMLIQLHRSGGWIVKT